MTQPQAFFLKYQEDDLRTGQFAYDVAPDGSFQARPDDDDWLTDDDDDFDIETGDDIEDEEELENPNAIPDTPNIDDEDDEGSWADDYEGGDDDDDLIDDDEEDDFLPDDDDDEEDDLLIDDEDEDEDDTYTSGTNRSFNADFEERPHGRTSGRMTDHEPGLTDFNDND